MGASLRRVWPPWPWLLAFVTLYGGMVGLTGYDATQWRATWPETAAILAPVLKIVMLPFVLLYGLYRVWMFHPIVRAEYRDWLARTPWTPNRPLPLGPVHLVWQDAVLLGIVLAMTTPFGEGVVLHVVLVFSFTYLVTLLVTMLQAEEWPAAYLVAFGMGWMVLLSARFLPFFVAGAITYAAARWGLIRSYRRFPWRPGLWKRLEDTISLPPGWPFRHLQPNAPPLLLPPARAVPTALVLSWFFFTLISRAVAAAPTPDKANDTRYSVLAFAGLLLTLTALLRITFYQFDRYVPPVSLAGRWATGRWIIPGYDQLFLAPAVGAVLFFGVPPLLQALGGEPAVSMTLGVLSAVLALTSVGPSREQWFLTGNHRILPTDYRSRPKEYV